MRGRGAVALVGLLALAACGAPHVRSPAVLPDQATLAELWYEPRDLATRDLFAGPGGAALTPDPNARWEFVKADTKGSSRGYDVRDAQGMIWSVKIGVEAQPEVVASRLLWAAGYHQPPTYYVPAWTLVRDGVASHQPPGRFRPELPTQRKVGRWSWHDNPFVDTTPLRGLIALNLMVNNWDLKTSQNVIYELSPPAEGARRWYVVRDVGAALGRTPGRVLDGRPNDLAAFEAQGFITGADANRVSFDYRRPHNELVALLRPADVRWACERWHGLTPQQWRDAFRAGGYTREQAERYIRKLAAKIDQGLSLDGHDDGSHTR